MSHIHEFEIKPYLKIGIKMGDAKHEINKDKNLKKMKIIRLLYASVILIPF